MEILRLDTVAIVLNPAQRSFGSFLRAMNHEYSAEESLNAYLIVAINKINNHEKFCLRASSTRSRVPKKIGRAA